MTASPRSVLDVLMVISSYSTCENESCYKTLVAVIKPANALVLSSFPPSSSSSFPENSNNWQRVLLFAATKTFRRDFSN